MCQAYVKVKRTGVATLKAKESWLTMGRVRSFLGSLVTVEQEQVTVTYHDRSFQVCHVFFHRGDLKAVVFRRLCMGSL